MKHYLFINGGSTIGIDKENKIYCVDDTLVNENGLGVYITVTKDQLKEILETKLKWIEDGWNKELKEEYKKLKGEL